MYCLVDFTWLLLVVANELCHTQSRMLRFYKLVFMSFPVTAFILK